MSESRTTFDDFQRVDMRVGRIVEALDFPEARKPAYKLRIDFGAEIGIKNSSAQLTVRYKKKEDLVGKRIIAVVNFPPKKVASFVSEVLVLGVPDDAGGIILLEPDSGEAPLGARVY